MFCLKPLQADELLPPPRLGSGPGKLPCGEGLALEQAQIQDKNTWFPTQASLVFFLLHAVPRQAPVPASDAPVPLVSSSLAFGEKVLTGRSLP